MDKKTDQPFYIGEKVICVDALPGASVKNGLVYEVYSCELDFCKGSLYWYVGVEGQGIRTHNRVRPSIFAPLQSATLMQFERLNESIPVHAN